MNLLAKLRHVPDIPRPGVDFIDITTLLKRPDAFREAVDQMAHLVRDIPYDLIIGAESRGFIMGAPLAYATGHGFVPVRKPGKLPAETIKADYQLEYGIDTLEMHVDAIEPGMRILVVDDLLATGGTAQANCRLVEKLGGQVAAVVFLIELVELKGREKLTGYPIYSLLQIE